MLTFKRTYILYTHFAYYILPNICVPKKKSSKNRKQNQFFLKKSFYSIEPPQHTIMFSGTCWDRLIMCDRAQFKTSDPRIKIHSVLFFFLFCSAHFFFFVLCSLLVICDADCIHVCVCVPNIYVVYKSQGRSCA